MQSIPFLSLAPQHDLIRKELEEGFKKVMEGSGFILGGEVEAFEREYAAYSGVNHCVAVANGMEALYISLKTLGVGPGAEVVVPALTCAPTWMAVSHADATLVPVDVQLNTFMLDEAKLERAITQKTKAIVPVNLYGHPAPLPAILKMANNKTIAVVEDNAQGHGASIHGKKTGSFGHINATSFYPTKNLGALGDGGAITTDDFRLAEQARRLRNYGTGERFHHDVIGINSRLDELQAAFLRIKLRHLDAWNAERSKNANTLMSMLAGVGDLILPTEGKGVVSNHHLFVVRTERRNALRKFLQEQGIATDVHYPVPPHLQQAYQKLGFSKGDFPVAERICETIMSLPIWPGMSEEQVASVSQSIKRFFKK